ncbi:Trypanosome variant surface glycoprotein (A-type)/Trypanosome variant surface glycoprotein C-terminal domain containing protein, putative [Trypanosoma equiperdum]|uniref:Trypanosome variant surface glycoprotein (A-type)/Trypanosome variant surface glycoprotein C-terminal domain containing protein, putative n=1 Tax=Trypanosoma equiperdum TaxID=5694 RepID=A0A1G4I7T7_TRYEQ|nr:Trypanosome variant surface glycoprotein (A-type)/Trypanosome variant surface glycoprotein C-terminal domain containing protein, putative [Trypanosoma equiperdum]
MGTRAKHREKKAETLSQRLTKLAALAIFLAAPAEAAAHFGLLPVTWNPMCRLSEELHDIAGSAAHKAQDAAKEAEKMTLAAKRFGIFAAKNTQDEQSAAARFLRLHFEIKAAAALEHLANTLMPANFKAAAQSSYLKGRIDETLKTLEGITSATNNGCLVTATTSATTRREDNLGDHKCRLSPPDLKAADHQSAELGPSGYTKLKKGNSDETAQAANTFNCRLLSGEENNGIGATEATTAFTLADGYISVPTTDTAVTLTDLTSASSISSTKNKAWASAHTAVQGILTKDEAAYKNTTAALKGDASFSDLLGRILLGTSAVAEPTVGNARTNLFGEPTKTKVDDLSKLVDETEIPKGIGGLAKPTKLKDISNINELTAILGYYEFEDAKELNNLKQKLDAVEKEKQKNSPQEKQKECEAHKNNKKDCENAKCIWKGGDSESKGDCEVNTTKVAEQAKQPATGAASGADPNCGQYTDPDTCAKAPGKPKEGKKSVCGWIDYIEGQGKVEAKCRDSSFLLNKKLALSVVSAAFVALLF